MEQRRLPRQELPEIRARFARMVDDGVPAAAIMSVLRWGRATFFTGRRASLAGGLASLEVRPVPGGVSKLSDGQTAQLRGWLVERDPRQFQFAFAWWTRVN